MKPDSGHELEDDETSIGTCSALTSGSLFVADKSDGCGGAGIEGGKILSHTAVTADHRVSSASDPALVCMSC